jgi:hypothetical protein
MRMNAGPYKGYGVFEITGLTDQNRLPIVET